MPDAALLLTPGPLTTSRATREAMLQDWGSRDMPFRDMTRRVRDRLVALVHGQGTHVAVPLQGSGTFAVEAMIGTFVPRQGKLLILVNGAYGHRMAKICAVAGRTCRVHETAEDVSPTAAEVDAILAADAAITHVAMVHCETTSGILNPLAEIADVVAKRGRAFLIDAMSSFGAIEIDARRVRFDALAASSNKCLEGAPGLGFVLCRDEALKAAKGNAHALTLDLADQCAYMDSSGQQWRFTPPTHVLAAFDAAIAQHAAEGGVAGRGGRYRRNLEVLVSGMRALGFETLLDDAKQAPIIVTFLTPDDPHYDFERFYAALAARGFVIYPGKTAKADSFRVGCIGQVHEPDLKRFIGVVREILAELGVSRLGPRKAA
jgi:2-aminoethylphosphonate-pyruvate transaminase